MLPAAVLQSSPVAKQPTTQSHVSSTLVRLRCCLTYVFGSHKVAYRVMLNESFLVDGHRAATGKREPVLLSCMKADAS